MKWVVLNLFLIFFTSYANEYEYTQFGTNLKVLGQSGKVSIARGDKKVQFQVDYISEVDENGFEVGKTGNNKHSINTMATQSFIFDNIKETSFQNVTTHEFSFRTDINGIGKLKVDTIFIAEAGSLGTETETWKVSSGDVKFNIELSDWTFCPTSCSGGTAKYIDLGIEIKGNKRENKGNQTIDIGDATVELSNRVNVDGVEIFMPAGYPKIETKGLKQLFMFRFPTFQNKLIYDPVIQLTSTSNGYKSMSLSFYVFVIAWSLISII